MYAYNAELLCESCGKELAERLRAEGVADDGDSDGFPQHANDGGESDSPNHCPSGEECLGEVIDLTDWGLPVGAQLYGAETRRIGELLDEGLTEHGVSYLKEMLGDPPRTPYQRALHRLWRAAFSDDLA